MDSFMGVRKIFLLCLWLFIFVNLIGVGMAQSKEFTHLISNSEDWKDVYSVMHYATLKGVGSDFLVSTKHGPLLLTGLSRNSDIRVISSRDKSFVINYNSMILNEGFADADEVFVRDANLELIEDLPEITNFIVVGNTYGYNAIAVAPYSVLNRAWVFLADRANIDEIDAILSSRDVDELLIYGFVDREVRDTLDKYNPEIMDSGDRFQDNIDIVKKYLEVNPVTQITLTNGEFIEKELMAGNGPILFTGKENVPDRISEYIKSSDIEVGVLIGAELVGAATNIRRGTGISVIVKFARGARNPAGSIAAVEGLDLFYLPIPILELDLYSAKYNRATSQLELTYKSDSNVPIFFKGTITPQTEAGQKTRIGDVDPIFIAPNDFKTVAYSGLDFAEDAISLDVFTLYGDTLTSLEKILERKIDVEIVNIIDACDINIVGVKYSKQKDAFIVKLENLGSVDCYADVELEDVIIDRKGRTLGSKGSVAIEAKKSAKIIIEQEMTDADLEENDFVNVVAYYGEREEGLVKVLRGRFELNVELLSYATIGLIAFGVVVVVAIIILFIMWKRREDEDW